MRAGTKQLTCSDVALLTGRDILLQLREYLIAYRVFASGATSTGEEYGQHNPYEFSSKVGLCANLYGFTSSITDSHWPRIRLKALLVAALDAQIEMWAIENPLTGDVDTDYAYPFGEDDYYARHDANTMHECPKRLAFVSHTIEVLLV